MPLTGGLYDLQFFHAADDTTWSVSQLEELTDLQLRKIGAVRQASPAIKMRASQVLLLRGIEAAISGGTAGETAMLERMTGAFDWVEKLVLNDLLCIHSHPAYIEADSLTREDIALAAQLVFRRRALIDLRETMFSVKREESQDDDVLRGRSGSGFEDGSARSHSDFREASAAALQHAIATRTPSSSTHERAWPPASLVDDRNEHPRTNATYQAADSRETTEQPLFREPSAPSERSISVESYMRAHASPSPTLLMSPVGGQAAHMTPNGRAGPSQPTQSSTSSAADATAPPTARVAALETRTSFLTSRTSLEQASISTFRLAGRAATPERENPGRYSTTFAIFIGNLPYLPSAPTQQDLVDAFARYEGLTIVTRQSRKPFAFIEFSERESLEAAIQDWNGVIMWGRRLDVKVAKGRKQ